MKVGDRILAINGNDVASCNLMEAVDMLRHSTHNMTSLVVEYDVSYMGASYGIPSSIFTRISGIYIFNGSISVSRGSRESHRSSVGGNRQGKWILTRTHCDVIRVQQQKRHLHRPHPAGQYR